MSEKLLIIAEKSSAAKNFEKALGGKSGSFDGNDYTVIHLHGHILENPVPDETALPEYKQVVGKFSQLKGIPWNPSWFDFNKKLPKGDDNKRTLRDIERYIKQGYIPVIASDIDESGEGDLIVWEVLIYLNYNGKVYREYHLDESVKEIQKSIRNKKEVTSDDPVFKMAFARSNMDYLTQQLTRVSTMGIQAKGYKLPSPVPMGRLKSVILVILGDQENAIKAYKPSSEFESRYKLDNLILQRKGMTRFKTKDEWDAEGLPEQSRVKEVRQVPGKTIPPKAFTLSGLAGAMSKKGMKVKQFQDTYQKMYEAGYVSYPRTEDDFVSPEQFNDVLPHVDTVLNLLSLPSAAFTHREPRNTHVKTGGAHGALRFGEKIPNAVSELDSQFGKYASDIYKLLSERFLMMFLEDTEWIRHEYETTDTNEPFKGSIKIITKQGVVDPNEDDKPDVKLPNTNNKADLYPHEVKSVKPATPTTEWLLNQLEKVDVGTGATRVSTLSNLSGNKDTYPIKEAKALSLSMMGWVGHQAAQGTTIGSVEGTRYITQLSKDVKNGKDVSTALMAITDVITKDVDVINGNPINLDGLNLQKAKPKAEGTWHGRNIVFTAQYMDYTFTDADIEALLAGKEIAFTVTGKDKKKAKVKGTLADLEYNGHEYVGFKGQWVKEGYVQGVWQGKNVTIKGSFMDHVFTEQELTTLFNGGEVTVTTHKNGATYEGIKGKLEVQEYNGNKFLGYKARFPEKEGYVKGIWKGKEVTFKGSFMGHTFTDGEIKLLLAGTPITFEAKKKNGDKTDVTGELKNKTYKGKKFVGFDPGW